MFFRNMILLTQLLFFGFQSEAKDLIYTYSPHLQKLTSELKIVESQLNILPQLNLENRSVQFGYHSRSTETPPTNHWVEIDLGAEKNLDAIALIPAYAATPTRGNAGYGFPLRFKIELLDKNKKNPILIVDHTKQDHLQSDGSPFIEDFTTQKGQYLKLTVTKMDKSLDRYFMALSEIMIFNGQMNIAVGKKVRATNSINTPGWSTEYLTDFHTPIGAPVNQALSPSNGLLVREEGKISSEKWIQIDLNEPHLLQEIRLYPSRPTDFADRPGSGFPKRFKLEGSLSKDFNNPILLFSTGDEDFPSPGDNPVSIPIRSEEVKSVRLSVWKNWMYHDKPSLSMSEIELYSNQKNVALNQKVSSSELFSNPKYPRWYPSALVDGYNSRFKLMELKSWLSNLKQRHQLNQEKSNLLNQLNQAKSDFILLILWLFSSITLIVITFFIIYLIKAHKTRQQKIIALRQQISRDLHDDLGSHLGGIALISETAQDDPQLSQATCDDFKEIHKIALRTSVAMRDMVWLMKNESAPANELYNKLIETSKNMFPDLVVQFSTEQDNHPQKLLPIEIRRNTLLAFKEALHNIRKHANTNKAKAIFNVTKKNLSLIISDYGAGFDKNKIKKGYGLNNLAQRARNLDGHCQIESSEKGTTIRFNLPL